MVCAASEGADRVCAQLTEQWRANASAAATLLRASAARRADLLAIVHLLMPRNATERDAVSADAPARQALADFLTSVSTHCGAQCFAAATLCRLCAMSRALLRSLPPLASSDSSAVVMGLLTATAYIVPTGRRALRLEAQHCL